MARESRYPLRLPSELYEQVKAECKRTGVSINEFIVRLVAGFFVGPGDLERRVAELEQRLAQLEQVT